MCSSAPDMSGIADAAKASAKIGQEALDWYKQQYKDQTPIRDKATQMALDQANLQNEASRKQISAADESLDYQKNVFRPVEEKLASEAMNFDTPARREAEAAAARADVEQQIAGERQASERALARTGVAPNSGRSLALQGTMNLGAAKLKAGAANTARRQVEAQGTARLGDVANLGRGIASGQVAQLQSGVQAGNSAVSNAGTANATNMSGNSTMGQGFSTGLQGYGQSGNLYAQQAQIQQKADESSSNGLMQAGMMAGMFMSDRKAKKNVKPVKGEEALSAARRIPVKSWQYRKGKGDGGKHIGPMAQDVRAAAGEDAAPGGKMIDAITMQGITLAAVKQLDRKVSRLAKAQAKN